MKYTISLLLIFLFIVINDATGQYDVRYEPSQPEVIAKMLTMAYVTGNDIVYDLGCGDGRIVINAAKKYGAHGVGIDIDPERIVESKENALKEGVTDKVLFVEQNLFEADISEATVVMLFLLPSVNLKLRPKLFRELAPGTRIVSHEHYMGEWKPDRTAEVEADGRNHMVYLWILPGNVSGTWEWTGSTETGKRHYSLNLAQKFQEISGTLYAGESIVPVTEMTIEGNRLRFAFEEETGNQTVTRMFVGLVNEKLIKGTVITKTGAKSRKNNWRAKRHPSTIVPLEY